MPPPSSKPGPSVGKPLPSYPTPNVSDAIYSEIVDAWQGKYQTVEYGTSFNDVDHGAFPKDLPNHILVYDGLSDATGQFRKRIWASNRVDEDTYNYAVEYSGSKDFPIYIRTYVVKRDEYAPVNDLAADPIHIGAYLVKEQLINEVEPEELRGQYVKVVRIYEKLPGPLVHKVDYDNNQSSYPIVTTVQRIRLTDYSPGTEGTDFCPVSGYGSLILFEQHLNPTNTVNVKEDQRIYEKTPNQIVTTKNFDYELNSIVTVTMQKIASGQTPIPSNLTLDLVEKPIDKWRTLQTITSLSALPAAKVEYKTGQYLFPVLVTGINIVISRLNDVVIDGTSYTRREASWNPSDLRQVQNIPALYRVTTSFHDAAALPNISIFSLPSRDLVYNGIALQINITNVLNDLIVLSLDMAPGADVDGRYGNLVETIQFNATSPSATDYLNSYVNTYRTVGVEQQRYRGNIWVQQLTEVLLQ